MTEFFDFPVTCIDDQISDEDAEGGIRKLNGITKGETYEVVAIYHIWDVEMVVIIDDDKEQSHIDAARFSVISEEEKERMKETASKLLV